MKLLSISVIIELTTFHITALGKADLALALAGAEVSVGIGDLAKFATVILELCPASKKRVYRSRVQTAQVFQTDRSTTQYHRW